MASKQGRIWDLGTLGPMFGGGPPKENLFENSRIWLFFLTKRLKSNKFCHSAVLD